MSSTKPLVLILGATGKTGRSLVNGLLASGNFRVAAGNRAASLNGEPVQKLRARGVEVRAVDLDTDTPAQLQAALAGVDILVSAVQIAGIPHQRRIFDAAKAVGTVKRVVPCDFATPGARGVRFLNDWKLDAHEYIKALGLPYTFIDVGGWAQLLFPLPTAPGSAPPDPFRDASIEHDPFRDVIVGIGAEYKLLITDLRHVGAWAARILADPRTLNRSVIVWEWELTHLAARELGEAVCARTGGDPDLKRTRKYVSADEIRAGAEEAEGARQKAPFDVKLGEKAAIAGYQHSMFVLNEASLEGAKRLGYLDAQELYPDFEFQKPEAFLEEQLKDETAVWPAL